MAKDHYIKTRAGGYYNGLLTGTHADFLKLLRKYSICPPDTAGGTPWDERGLVSTKQQAPAHRARLAGTTRTDDVRLQQIQNNKLVAYIDLSLVPRGDFATTGHEGGDRIYFTSTYTQTAGYVPVYFLPWNSQGAAVRITIPIMGTNPLDPNVFFTAAINGCSIFFQGHKNNPTIYHCGGSTGHNDITASAEFWEEVIAEYLADDASKATNLGALKGGPKRVDKRDYVTQVGVTVKETDLAGHKVVSKSTARAKQYMSALKKKHGLFDSLTIESVAPWGCVCGWRDNTTGNWSFYLQENATITYHKVVKRSLRHPKGQKVKQRIARPMQYREIWPNGDSHVCVRAPVPKIH